MKHPRALHGALVVAFAASSLVLVTAPAYAEHGGVLIGDHAAGPFRHRLAEPLFDAGTPLVPERGLTSSFYVKNDSDTVAYLSFATAHSGALNAFAEALVLTFEVAGYPSVARVGRSRPEMACESRPIIEPGTVVPVRVDLGVDGLQGQAGMGQSAQVEVVATLTEVTSDDQVQVCGTQEHADTGAGRGGDEDEDCLGDGAVVTVIGAPTCVPTTVDAGAAYGEGVGRDPISVSGIALLLGFVGWLTGWFVRRREGEPTA